MSPILVIGGTGNVGSHVLSQLAATDAHVRLLVRHPDGVHCAPQVEIARGDLTVPQSLDDALDGVDTVFLVWTAPLSACDAALERIATRARRIVFLSAPLKTQHPLFQQPNPLRDATAHIERVIEASGLEWTFLRPGMMAGNARLWWAPQIRAGNAVRWPYLDVPTAPVDERDIAAAAVRVLRQDGHAVAEYVLTGPESLTQFEQIATIGRAIGRQLRIEEIPPDAAPRELLTLIPFPAVVSMLLNAWRAAAGHPAFVSSTVEDLTGAPARTFFEWATQNADLFRSP